MTDATTSPPAPPANAIEARARLDALTSNQEWGSRLLAGDVTARREFNDLMELAATGNSVDDVVEGKATPLLFETTMPGELSTYNKTLSAEWLREIGIPDPGIKRILAGERFTKEDVAAARAWKVKRCAARNGSNAS